MAGLKVEEKSIGRARYKVSQLGFGDARKVLRRGTAILAPAVAKLEGVKFGKVLDLDLSTVGGAFSALLDRLTDEELDYFVETFAAVTQVKVGAGNWTPLGPVMELHFAGPEGLRESVAWLRFCAELNFGPFSRGSEAGEGDRPETPAS